MHTDRVYRNHNFSVVLSYSVKKKEREDPFLNGIAAYHLACMGGKYALH